MKIILADDDKLIRYYMKNMIDEILTDYHEILEVSNGKTFLETCTKSAPDIAFVDINMPYIDGISAIEQAKIKCPSTKFVILTAYADFSYAKRCIGLGVVNYLLKPIDQGTLETVLNELRVKLNTDHSIDNFKFEHKVISMFNNPTFDKNQIFLQCPENNTYYSYFEFFISPKNDDMKYESIYSDLSDKLQNYKKNILNSGKKSVLFNSKLGNLALVIESNENNVGSINNSINTILSSCNSIISCLCTNSATMSLLNLNTDKIKQFHSCIFVNKTHEVLNFESITTTLKTEDFNFLGLISNVVSAFVNGNQPEYKINIKNILKNVSFNSLNINFQYLISFFKQITGTNLKSTNLKQFFNDLLNLSDTIKLSISKPSLDKMDLIKQYIDKNYMNDISISSIAEIYEITPNYASKLFHEKMGIKFTDYLIQVRIYNAKLLLSVDHEISIKTVANLVGYYSPRHFTNIFHKATNMYPSDYKKSLTL